jgi:ribonuclease HI
MEVVIICDGSCSGNPGPGGWAAKLTAKENGKVLKQSTLTSGAKETTNNRMELTAALMALRQLNRPSVVTIISDSEYLNKGMNERLAKWVAKGWKTTTGPVKNQDLWEQLLELNKKHVITWGWTPGKTNDVSLNIDELAKGATMQARVSGDFMKVG